MFSYHCALNADVNELLELCAPLKFIHGQKCVEYNSLGTIIQESIVDCSNATVPCPEVFQSTEAFKYQSCYDAVQISEEEPKATLNCSTFRSGNSTLDQPERTDNTVFVAVFSATLIFATLVFHFFFYTFMRWRRRKLFENIQDDGI